MVPCSVKLGLKRFVPLFLTQSVFKVCIMYTTCGTSKKRLKKELIGP